jgi:4-hydroxy-3-methylbut-2-enyl diphosphate reductase
MKIILDKNAGFCPGVKAALKIAYDTASKYKKKIYTDGELIHNTQVLLNLEAKGITQITQIVQINENFKPNKIDDVLLIRAHGISPARRQKLEKLEKYGCSVIDCTCVYVKKISKILEKFSKNGFDVIILGDENHAEIQGLIGYVKTKIYVAQNETELHTIKDIIGNKTTKLLLVAQSTLDEEFFNSAEIFLAKYFTNLVAINTICKATKARQQGLKDLISANVDAIVVIGDKTSANTCRLAFIASKYCKKVFHVENSAQLKMLNLKDIDIIGVTAGTSTPDFLITDVCSYLETIS